MISVFTGSRDWACPQLLPFIQTFNYAQFYALLCYHFSLAICWTLSVQFVQVHSTTTTSEGLMVTTFQSNSWNQIQGHVVTLSTGLNGSRGGQLKTDEAGLKLKLLNLNKYKWYRKPVWIYLKIKVWTFVKVKGLKLKELRGLKCLKSQAPSTRSRNGRKLSGFVSCGSGISPQRQIHCETSSSCRNAVVNIQGAGPPQKKRSASSLRAYSLRAVCKHSVTRRFNLRFNFKLSRNTF